MSQSSEATAPREPIWARWTWESIPPGYQHCQRVPGVVATGYRAHSDITPLRVNDLTSWPWLQSLCKHSHDAIFDPDIALYIVLSSPMSRLTIQAAWRTYRGSDHDTILDNLVELKHVF